MRIPQPAIPFVVPPNPVQALCSGRGGEIDVPYICCLGGRVPEAFELWAFDEDVVREVHPYARVKLLDDFREDTFYSHFFNARRIQIPFLGRRSVNMSVEFLDAPRATQKVGSSIATWTENILLFPTLFLLSRDMHMILLLPTTLSYAYTITNVFD